MVQAEEDFRVLGRILAIDPSSKNMGWAVYEGGKYVESGRIEFISLLGAVRESVWLLSIVGDIKYLVVEGSFLKNNVASLKKITTYSTILKVLVLEHRDGVEVVDVAPNSWQSKQLGGVSGAKRKERKELSVTKARDISKKELSNDEADAINIGGYFVIHGNINKKRETTKGVRKNSP